MTAFKKIALATAATLLMASTSVMAQGHHFGGGYRGNNNWVGPALIAGIIGYGIAQSNRPVVVAPEPVYVYPPAPQYVPQYVAPEPSKFVTMPNGETYVYNGSEYVPYTAPVYQETMVWDADYQVWRKKMVRIR